MTVRCASVSNSCFDNIPTRQVTQVTQPSAAARSELTPTGKLRVGLNMSNFLLTKKDPAGGAAKTGAWDVGFLGAEPQRAQEIDFTAAYVEIESTYLVPPGSPIKSIADVDRKGIRIAISGRSAYDLYLTRNLKNAELIRDQGFENVFKRFVDEKLEALAGLRPRLIIDQANLPGSRILDGNFTSVQQASGSPKGRPAGAQYLREFIEDVKASGLVAGLIEKHNVRGLTVAQKA
jgi:polar amino acid transport system substrate-binding protein